MWPIQNDKWLEGGQLLMVFDHIVILNTVYALIFVFLIGIPLTKISQNDLKQATKLNIILRNLYSAGAPEAIKEEYARGIKECPEYSDTIDAAVRDISSTVPLFEAKDLEVRKSWKRAFYSFYFFTFLFSPPVQQIFFEYISKKPFPYPVPALSLRTLIVFIILHATIFYLLVYRGRLIWPFRFVSLTLFLETISALFEYNNPYKWISVALYSYLWIYSMKLRILNQKAKHIDWLDFLKSRFQIGLSS